MKAHYQRSKLSSNYLFLTLISIGVILSFNSLNSQTLVVTNFDADGFGEAEAMQDCGPPIGMVIDFKDHQTVPWIQGGTTWFGVPYDYISALSYGVRVNDCGTVRGRISSHCYVGGDGTNTMIVDWYNWASVYALLEPFYHAHVQSTYWYDMTIQVMPGGGYNVGDAIELFFQFHFSGSGWTRHENFVEDPVSTTNTCNFNGNSLIGNLYNFSNPPGVSGWRRETTNGSMMVAVGDIFTLDFNSVNQAEINPPGLFLASGQKDRAHSKFRGKITLSLDSIPAPPQFNPTYNPRIEFSLNIGSDAELSDPNQDNNEVFDPGDAYLMNGPFMAAPQNGVKDDATIFGFDPAPDQFNPATIVPVGSGVFQPGNYFDLNGMDNMQASLFGLSYGPGLPSISYFSDSLVFLAEYLLISYDDDAPQNWSMANAVPVNSQSPIAFDTYGKTTRADEVIAIDMDPYNVPSFPFTIDSLWNESNIHPNLAPNPDTGEERDNDVNALNYFPNQFIDGYFYFSVSHEATFNHPIVPGALNPGSVYQLLSPGNFVEVVNPVVHLGLIDGVDINAFSFGWVFDSIQARLGLALLFSVNVDDWSTLQDESGGLDPSMIYYSFLDGTHREFSEVSLRDNIDALTIVPHSFNGYALPATLCNPPSSLNITTTPTDALFSWIEPISPPSNGYEIELYDANMQAVHTAVVPSGTNSYTFIGLTPGETYTATIRSVCGATLFSIWVSIQFNTQAGVCDPPGSLTASVGTTHADLNWIEPMPPPAFGYLVVVTDGYGNVVFNGGFPVGTTAVIIGGLLPGNVYTAVVSSDCGGGVYADAVISFITNSVGDYGDAPDGDLAYPVTAVTGQFPTCIMSGAPGHFIFHEPNPLLYFGMLVDYEMDGNAGMCPVFNPNQYNQDECYFDLDAGLIKPSAYTIVGPIGSEMIMPCAAGQPYHWKTCRTAVWGLSIDIHVENQLPFDVYFNLLVDWNQDGQWSGFETCPDGSVVEEHAVVNFQIPANFAGPLAALSPPGFKIGPYAGYVWARFTLTEQPVQSPWDGTGIFSFGETEDYLIAIDDANLQGDVGINNTTFLAGSDECIEAEDEIIMSNSTVETGASLILTAGYKISILPTSHIQSGSYFLATIDQNGNYCSNYKNLLNVGDPASEVQVTDVLVEKELLFRIYPNPTSGKFSIEFLNPDDSMLTSVEIISLLGERIMQLEHFALNGYQFDLSKCQPGLYLIKVIRGTEVQVEKLIRK